MHTADRTMHCAVRPPCCSEPCGPTVCRGWAAQALPGTPPPTHETPPPHRVLHSSKVADAFNMAGERAPCR
eukprot:scaffold231703_cov32-Tisochrysis_lutea.AAC.5